MLHHIVWDKGGVFVECKGKSTIQDIHEVNGLLHGDARFEQHNFQLWDLVNTDLSQITMEEMQEPAALDLVASAYTKEVKVAIIVTEPYAVKLIESYCEQCNEDDSPWEAQLFSNLEDATKWVDL